MKYLDMDPNEHLSMRDANRWMVGVIAAMLIYLAGGVSAYIAMDRQVTTIQVKMHAWERAQAESNNRLETKLDILINQVTDTRERVIRLESDR